MDPETSPYQAPASELADPEPNPARPLLGILAGVATDLIGSTVVEVILRMFYGMSFALGWFEPGPQQGDVLTILMQIQGSIWTVLGGYWCARVGRQRVYLLVAIEAALVIAFSLWLAPPASLEDLPSHLITLPLALGGGYWWQRGNRSSA